MARYEIVTDKTQFEVTTRPGIPGLGATVSGARGSFEVTFGADGRPDVTAPIGGEFTMAVGDLRTGHQLVNAGVTRWLAGRDQAAISGTITEARARDDGRFDLLMTVEVRNRTVPLRGVGRVELTSERDRDEGKDAVEAIGTTMCDPRSFGIPLPPLVNLMVHVRWRISLAEPPS